MQRFADSYVQTANAARNALGDNGPSEYALTPPVAALDYDLAPSSEDTLPSDYAAGTGTTRTSPTSTPSQRGAPPTTTARTMVGDEQNEQDLERLVVDLLAQGQVGQAQAVAALLQQQRGGVSEPQPVATRSFEDDSSDDDTSGVRVWPQPRPVYDSGAGETRPRGGPSFGGPSSAGGQPRSTPQPSPSPTSVVATTRVRPAAAAIPTTAPAADQPPIVGTSFTPVVPSRASLPQRPTSPDESVVGTSFIAVPQGGLEGPLVVPEEDEFDAEFWDLAAVPPGGPGGDGGQRNEKRGPPDARGVSSSFIREPNPSASSSPPASSEKNAPGRGKTALGKERGDMEALDALEAQVAVALEEEALEKERARKLQEQLERTTAAVAELQVCVWVSIHLNTATSFHN